MSRPDFDIQVWPVSIEKTRFSPGYRSCCMLHKTICFFNPAPVGSVITKLYGSRICVLVGCCCNLTGFTLAGLFPNFESLYFTYGMLAGKNDVLESLYTCSWLNMECYAQAHGYMCLFWITRVSVIPMSLWFYVVVEYNTEASSRYRAPAPNA